MKIHLLLLSCFAVFTVEACSDVSTIVCGDGVVGLGEQCDDENTTDGDGCSAACFIEIPTFCGNGAIDALEECDDGNTVSGDGCSSDCQSDETCGNSVVDSGVGETCDDGNTTDGDGCESDCTLPICPSGLTDCNGVCTDTDVDSGNCGGCDDGVGSNTCASGEVCDGSGVCTLTCQPGLTDCNGVCTDTDVDWGNCGGCDDGVGSNTCTSGEVCDGSGVCTLTCQPGLSDCDNVCIDPSSNPAYCGATTCGDDATNGEVCNSGVQACVAGICADLVSPTCQNGATTVATSPNNDMIVCDDPTDTTCEQDFGTFCPASWHLCTHLERNNRNAGWNYVPDTSVLGVITCRGASGAGHMSMSGAMSTDIEWNQTVGSSLSSCTASYGCNERIFEALCCAPNPLCGNGVIDSVEEDCDDGNFDDTDACFGSCLGRFGPT